MHNKQLGAHLRHVILPCIVLLVFACSYEEPIGVRNAPYQTGDLEKDDDNSDQGRDDQYKKKRRDRRTDQDTNSDRATEDKSQREDRGDIEDEGQRKDRGDIEDDGDVRDNSDSDRDEPSEVPTPPPPSDPVEEGLKLINEKTLREELTFISSDDFNGRLSGTSENVKAADWLIGHLKELNIEPARGTDYRQSFSLNVGSTSSEKTANVVAILPGQDPKLKDEYVVIGAHMDHIGTLRKGYNCSSGAQGANSICNGADDNGSGTISVLNIAKALAAVRQSLKRSIVIMWFSGEEEGLIGSKHYVSKDPIFPIEQTVYMINMDMVGYLASNNNNLAVLGGASSTVGADILEDVSTKYPEVTFGITDRPGGGSDHAPFMAEGIPGAFFNTGLKSNPNYHKTSDTADKIDYAGMTVVAKIAFETAFRVANEPDLSTALAVAGREPLVSEEELSQSCHHLIKNPFIDEAFNIDFR